MGELLKCLKRQLKTSYKEDAKECIKIYNKLKDLNSGKVWSSQWDVLTNVNFEGVYPNRERIYKPSLIGKIFINGIK